MLGCYMPNAHSSTNAKVANMTTFRKTVAYSFAALLAFSSPAFTAPKLTFITLGTNAGPIPSPHRSEPANVVQFGGEIVLVDAGDGVSVELAKAGIKLREIHTIVLSHLHFDHIGGLFAVLGERYQSQDDSKLLTIYGPSGTKTTIDRLIAAMKPGIETVGRRSRSSAAALDNIKVVEVAAGSKFAVGQISIIAAENTHYATLKYSGPTKDKPISLSYRFNTPTRSICFTGDTGPSVKVERLCRDVDLLVSEISWSIPDITAQLRRYPQLQRMSTSQKAIMMAHFTKEHLSPIDVGLLAKHCAARKLVLTHDALLLKDIPAARAAIRGIYGGPITFANDVQTF